MYSSRPRRYSIQAPPPERVVEATPRRQRPAFEPSPADAVVTRFLLMRGLHLPAILVDDIIDWAEYWPRSTTAIDFPTTSPLVVRGSSNKFLVRCGVPAVFAVGNAEVVCVKS